MKTQNRGGVARGRSLLARGVVVIVLAVAAALQSAAATPYAEPAVPSGVTVYTWKNAADGAWTTGTNWDRGGAPGGTSHKAYFPQSLSDYTVSVTAAKTVRYLATKSPRMTLSIENAALTVTDTQTPESINEYAGAAVDSDPDQDVTIAISGAGGRLLLKSYDMWCFIGCSDASASPKGTVSIDLKVPTSGWNSIETAPLYACEAKSKLVFGLNSEIRVDATALGVPAQGVTNVVYLAAGAEDGGVRCGAKTGGSMPQYLANNVTVRCASGATGVLESPNDGMYRKRYIRLLVFKTPQGPQEEPEDPTPATGTPALTSPDDFATVATLPELLKRFNAKSIDEQSAVLYDTADSQERKELEAACSNASLPVVLTWGGVSAGRCNLKVIRDCDGTVVFETNTSRRTVAFHNPEIGRNYRWTVTTDGGASATRWFYAEAEGPRIISPAVGRVKNGRDMGGWATTDGLVVRQGLVYRSCMLEDYAVNREIPYWLNVLGIRFDLDLRTADQARDAGCGGDTSFVGPGVYHYCSDISDGVTFNGSYNKCFKDDAEGRAARQAYALDFRQLMAPGRLPAVFHCIDGRDRTGCFAWTLKAILGVSEKDLATDYFYPWVTFSASSQSSPSEWLPVFVNGLRERYPDASYPTLSEKATAFLLECGLTTGELAAYRQLMLELPEAKRTSSAKVSVPVPTVAPKAYTGEPQTADLVRCGYYDVTANAGGIESGAYDVVLTLKDPANAQWADGTVGAAKTLVFRIAGEGVAVPEIPSKTYTGAKQTADVPASSMYAVTANEGGINVGSYTVTLTLNGSAKWADGTTGAKNLAFEIVPASNVWTQDPSISTIRWYEGQTAGALKPGVTKFGTVTATIKKDGGTATAFSGTLPTAVGSYVITYAAPATTANYTAPAVTTRTVAFEIAPAGSTTETIWQGPANGNPATAANWSNGVPATGKHGMFPANSTNSLARTAWKDFGATYFRFGANSKTTISSKAEGGVEMRPNEDYTLLEDGAALIVNDGIGDAGPNVIFGDADKPDGATVHNYGLVYGNASVTANPGSYVRIKGHVAPNATNVEFHAVGSAAKTMTTVRIYTQSYSASGNTDIRFIAEGKNAEVRHDHLAGGDEWKVGAGNSVTYVARNGGWAYDNVLNLNGGTITYVGDQPCFNHSGNAIPELYMITKTGAGSSFSLTNSQLHIHKSCSLGDAATTLTLAGDDPMLEISTTPAYFRANLTVRLVPTAKWTTSNRRIYQSEGDTFSFASGIKYEIDVAAFAGQKITNTFCLAESATGSKTPTYNLPAASDVALVGKGADGFDVAFSKSGRKMLVTLSAKQGHVDPPVHVHEWTAWTLTSDGQLTHSCTAAGCTVKTETKPMKTGYMPVEYVQSNVHTQYVDTGIVEQERIRVQMDFEPTAVRSCYMLAANGWVTSNENRQYVVSFGNDDGVWRYGLNAAIKTTAGTPANAAANTRYLVDASFDDKSFKLTVRNQATGTSGTKTETFSESLKTTGTRYTHYLFGLHSGKVGVTGKCTSPTLAKLYACNIWTNGSVLARSYFPVQETSSGVFGLYDAVEDRFCPSGTDWPFDGPTVAPAPCYVLAITNKTYVADSQTRFFATNVNDTGLLEIVGTGRLDYPEDGARNYIGCKLSDAQSTGVVTVRFNAKESGGNFGWTAAGKSAIAVTGGDSKLMIGNNVVFDVDVTAMGVPAVGTTKTLYLVTTTDKICFGTGGVDLTYDPEPLFGRSTIKTADGATARLEYTSDCLSILLRITAQDRPTVDGETVEADKVFAKAKSTKPIVYPSKPTLTGEAGVQRIVFGGKTVAVPAHYTATLAGNTVTIALNDNAKPVLADGEGEKRAIIIGDAEVTLHIGNLIDGLLYSVLKANDLNGDWTELTKPAATSDFTVERPSTEAAAFYTIKVTD